MLVNFAKNLALNMAYVWLNAYNHNYTEAFYIWYICVHNLV